MNHVTNHAEPTPTMRIASNHDCAVGSGSLACQRSNQNAAATETTNCMKRMRGV